MLNAAKRCGVKKLVFTSSTGVVWSVKDIVDADETYPVPPEGYDAYHETKARAEKLVLNANNNESMKTVALRPCGIYG